MNRTIEKSQVAHKLLEHPDGRFRLFNYGVIKPLIPDWSIGKQVSIGTLTRPTTTITAQRDIGHVGLEESSSQRFQYVVKNMFSHLYDVVRVDINPRTSSSVVQIELITTANIEIPMVAPPLVGSLMLTDVALIQDFGIEGHTTIDFNLARPLLQESGA
jgi:hypothetical protein